MGLFATLTITVPSVTMLRVFIYCYTECNLVSAIMLNAIMLNVVVLSVVAPPFSCKDVFKYDCFHFNHFLLNVLGRLLREPQQQHLKNITFFEIPSRHRLEKVTYSVLLKYSKFGN